MSFIISLILLLGLGIWVAYHLFVLRTGNAKAGETYQKYPVLYWIVLAAQVLFSIALLYKLFNEIFPNQK